MQEEWYKTCIVSYEKFKLNVKYITTLNLIGKEQCLSKSDGIVLWDSLKFVFAPETSLLHVNR